MANSEWDKYLRDLLGDFKSEGETPHWEELAQQLDSSPSPTEEPDPLQDENLRDSLSNYKVSSEVEGWERIQASLDAADREFDENVRRKIHHYGPQYDPMSWPLFLKRLSESKLLRAKLIALKVVEASAVILLLLTVLNMGRLGTIPFDKTIFEKEQPASPAPQPSEDRADLNSQHSNTNELASAEVITTENAKTQSSPSRSSNQTEGKKAKSTSPVKNKQNSSPADQIMSSAVKNSLVLSSPDENITNTIATLHLKEIHVNQPENQIGSDKKDIQNSSDGKETSLPIDENYITDALASLDINFDSPEKDLIPNPKYVRQLKRTFLEFGIVSQTDYNRLRMPEDKLSSAGRQIVFPQQGIPSQGYGAGFTVGMGHPRWALESGIIYSSKEFKPGRQLIVGGVFDNGSVDFEAMRLQLVTLPFQYRYRIQPKGRLKAYALAGFGLHVIVQSDIDVLIKYNFPSLSIGENPNNDPNLANTIRETRRISEHFRDGAPFSTKSFFSANAGLGLEYSLSQQKTLFLQTALQYQIPDLKFSNNNGKHLRSISLQAGVRTPLGT